MLIEATSFTKWRLTYQRMENLIQIQFGTIQLTKDYHQEKKNLYWLICQKMLIMQWLMTIKHHSLKKMSWMLFIK